MACKTDKLIATIKAKVEPMPELIELLRRYRDGLNLAIRWAVEEAKARGRPPTLAEAHKTLYEPLKAVGLPSVIAQMCYREALAVVKSYLAKGARGSTPVVKKLHMWLRKDAYRVRDGQLYITGGYKAKIVGIEERYEEGDWREAMLVYRYGDMYLYIAVEIPKLTPVTPRGVIAIDINERYVYYGNSQWIRKMETPVEKAARLRKLAEKLQRKYSSTHHGVERKSKRLQERIRRLHKKARDVVEDWARKTAVRIVEEARRQSYAVAVEDLTGLISSIRKLPKEHRAKLMVLAYRRLLWWIKWQATKRGVVVVEVDPKGSSTTCPKCYGKMEEVKHRHMKCIACGFKAGRDVVAILNIEKKARSVLSNPTFPPLWYLRLINNINPLVKRLMGCCLGGRPPGLRHGGNSGLPDRPPNDG